MVTTPTEYANRRGRVVAFPSTPARGLIPSGRRASTRRVKATMTDEITTTDELARADFERIEYAKVRLAKGEQTQYDGGRIIGRYTDDLTLRYRGHEVTVPNIRDWELVEFKPVTSDAERRLIEQGWDA